MKIEQLYTDCLAEAAYYIESNGEAAIIDPLRDPAPYIKMANDNGATIKYILETHFHADFVSGHIELAKATGAQIVYGPTAQADYSIYVAKDGEELPLGNTQIKVLHTPGHTMESSCFLVEDKEEKRTVLFSGDTLFIGDVGRPDLAVKKDLTKEDLAGLLYDSLQEKILPLNDNVIIYPGHGAGSACGKHMSEERYDSLGHQKQTNYALRPDLTKEDFIAQVINGIQAPPPYFPKNAALNKSGYGSFVELMQRANKAINIEDFEAAMQEKDTLVLDVRPAAAFLSGHIPGALFVGLEGRFASWVGSLVEDLETPILLVCEEGQAEEAIKRLARVAYDNVLGYLNGGMEAWRDSGKQLSHIKSIAANELLLNNDTVLFDVRNENEFKASHVLGAENKPLEQIRGEILNVPSNKSLYVHCKSGYRSAIACAILKMKGVDPINVKGGFDAIVANDLPVTSFVCQSSSACV